MKVAVAFVALCGVAVSANFIKLRENCRGTAPELEGEVRLGTCVTAEFCCRALGGTIVEPLAKGAVSRSFPLGLARSIGEDQKGCSYNGVCCVFPELEDYDCSVCGLKGNGDLSRALVPDIDDKPTEPPTTTAPPVKDLVPRIVSGNDADRYEWCWQVALMNSTGLFGGGALIARNWVVTAAHKVAGRYLDEFIVVLGEYDFQHEVEDRNVYYATPLNVKIHPNYNPENYNYNLALIRIPDAPCQEDNVCPVCLSNEDVDFTTTTTTEATTTTHPAITAPSTTTTTYSYGGSGVDPIRSKVDVKTAIANVNKKQDKAINVNDPSVPDMSMDMATNRFADKVCYMTGWGSTGLNAVAPTLQEAYMMIIREDECEEAFLELNVLDADVPESAFCGGEPSWETGSCYGDGGGPLVCQDAATHAWELWGVISLGANMCMPVGEQGPTIFTDVGQNREWIEEAIHEFLPDPAGPQDGRKAYRVPDCGSNIGKPCPLPRKGTYSTSG